MTVGTFNYPGGKTTIAEWIIQYIPDHEVYVEPFGGSAGVLANKPKSPLEVYNDTASLCVDFFRAVKQRPDELQHWVQSTPYSRELFEEYTQKLQQDRPDDLVERAGMFWYVQFVAFSAKGVLSTDTPVFGTVVKTHGRKNTTVDYFKQSADSIDAVCERFRAVEIENLDFETVFEKYDGESTVFYCDPPYVEVGDSYYQTGSGGFDHSRFVNALHDLDGKWLISYDNQIPPELRDYTIIDRTKHTNMSDSKREKTESLVMNFDADGERVMSELGQQTLSEVGD